MKIMFLSAFLIFVVLVSAGCASPKLVFRAMPDQEAGQELIYSDGSEAIYSNKVNQVVVAPIGMKQSLSERHHFFIKIVNNEQGRINVGSSSVTAELLLSENYEVGVWTYDELVEDAERRRNTAIFATALVGAASVYSASQSAYSYDSGSFSGYDSYGGSYYGTYSGYSYNPAIADAAVAAASLQTAQNVAMIENGLSAELASYGEVFKLTTIFTNQEHGGVLVLDKLSNKLYGDTLNLKVQAGSEIHEFKFHLTEPPKKKRSHKEDRKDSDSTGKSWKFDREEGMEDSDSTTGKSWKFE